jgi:hypothetical protein
MSTYIATDRTGRQLCEGETIQHTNGWKAVYHGLQETTEDALIQEPYRILISWEDDDRNDRRYPYNPRQFQAKIIAVEESPANFRVELGEAKLRVELARMTAELAVLPGTLPTVEVSLTWTEAVALEEVIKRAIR